MSTRVPIPLVSTNAADVTVGAWHIRPGEPVTRGQVLLDVSTDKAAFEVESPAEGLLLATFAPPRSVVPIGYVVALVGAPGERDDAIESDNAALVAAHLRSLVAHEPAAEAPRPGIGVAPQPAGPDTAVETVRATPKAKRLARENHIDLAKVQSETGAAIITEAVLAPYLP